VTPLRSNNKGEYGMIWFDIEGPQYWKDKTYNAGFMARTLRTVDGWVPNGREA
jgi:hypothetical protein